MYASGLLHIWKRSLKTYIKRFNLQRVVNRNYGTRTVYALSSGSGKCAVAVIRVSGPKSKCALELMCKGAPLQRIASLRKLYHPLSKDLLDKALVLWFPGPQSFSGEDSVEFHVHGGPAVIQSILEALGSISGLQPAELGEFTKQAFLNGKLDLTEVEGLGDLIHAETEAQRKQALRQMDGDLGKLYSSWRARLIKCLANSEAFIDFHEEENIEDDILDSVSKEIFLLKDDLTKHLNDNRRGERLRDGLSVVIAGEPNAGKSSLLNSICQRPAAIVSPIAGTTRDVVETALNIAGYPVLFSDTAGLRDTDDPVEREGVSRAVSRVASSDLTVLVMDGQKQQGIIAKDTSLSEFVMFYKRRLGLINSVDLGSGCGTKFINDRCSEGYLGNTMVVVNKLDLVACEKMSAFVHNNKEHVCAISCHTGEGFDLFMDRMVSKIRNLCGDPLIGSPSLTQARHRYHLERCCLYLDQAGAILNQDIVLTAERLRLAIMELGQVTGAVSAEDILDVIFRDFCIGK